MLCQYTERYSQCCNMHMRLKIESSNMAALVGLTVGRSVKRFVCPDQFSLLIFVFSCSLFSSVQSKFLISSGLFFSVLVYILLSFQAIIYWRMIMMARQSCLAILISRGEKCCSKLKSDNVNERMWRERDR